jgi:heptosyltransferase-1
MHKIIVVKTSSLGDIIQAFDVLYFFHQQFSEVEVDWVVEERFISIVAAHPLVNRAISFDIRSFRQKWKAAPFWRALKRSIKAIRRTRYDVLFDLQGNCKSGVITLLCRAGAKVGFGRKSVREWPNLIATRQRFEVSHSINIHLQYLSPVCQFYGHCLPAPNGQARVPISEITNRLEGVRIFLTENEKRQLSCMLTDPLWQNRTLVMVCPGAKWINKQLPLPVWHSFLDKIQSEFDCVFLLVWGSDTEKKMCEAIHAQRPECRQVMDRLSLPLWQNLMCYMDLVIAMDSSALYLCATTATPSYSIFGPTSLKIFKPPGPHHHAFQGSCPYHQVFDKQCSRLRNCPTGACIRNLSAERVFNHFRKVVQIKKT